MDIELLIPLADSIIKHWDPAKFDTNILTFEIGKQYTQIYEY